MFGTRFSARHDDKTIFFTFGLFKFNTFVYLSLTHFKIIHFQLILGATYFYYL